MNDAGRTGSDGIKVVIADVPQLLAAVVRRAVKAEKDMTIVAEVGSEDALAKAVEHPIDVVITAATTRDLAPPFRALLFGPRGVPIVAISVDGQSVEVYDRSVTRAFGLEDLIRLIRAAVAGSRPTVGG